ncbi:iron complex transport system substrate-binding protein [Afifella marina DSM 2698]|uniref:Iron complex transport system substrate-binding protein n=2 Tax=Afifella marina TaxID=1080 RepID=A0A1G5M6S1_AFIMA|nr:ABC transporter substrate-binding protein [Afifella marina]SCZ20451.1 iron complex transport system substrate-binding protein [Afifella marina DSM 2698]
MTDRTRTGAAQRGQEERGAASRGSPRREWAARSERGSARGRKKARTLTMALLGLSLFAAAPAAAQETTSAQKKVIFAPDVSLVAIGGSITEIVYALGEEDRLVARDTTSTYPEAAKALPDVGYMRQLSPEGVLSVNPGGILSLEGSGPPDAVQVLKQSEVPYVTIEEGYDRDGVLTKIREVGEALGAEEKAQTLADQVAGEFDALEKDTAAVAAPKRVLFLMSMQGGKLLAAGRHTAADAMIRLSGGENAISGYEGYKALSEEAVIDAAPDAILMMAQGASHGIGTDQVFANPALAATPAGETKNLIRMDGLYLLGFGPRAASAARELHQALYGAPASN